MAFFAFAALCQPKRSKGWGIPSAAFALKPFGENSHLMQSSCSATDNTQHSIHKFWKMNWRNLSLISALDRLRNISDNYFQFLRRIFHVCDDCLCLVVQVTLCNKINET
jgi:hypothetical protein